MDHLYLRIFLTIFFLSSSQAVFSDSLENFFSNRYSLFPPTEDESQAVTNRIQAFLDHVIANDLTEAYFLDTNSEFHGQTSFENFRIFSREFEGLNLREELDFHSVNFTNDEKTKADYIQTYINKKNQRTSTIKFLLSLEDNKWLISGVQIFQTRKTGK